VKSLEIYHRLSFLITVAATFAAPLADVDVDAECWL
jgi:hypothetical protein